MLARDISLTGANVYQVPKFQILQIYAVYSHLVFVYSTAPIQSAVFFTHRLYRNRYKDRRCHPFISFSTRKDETNIDIKEKSTRKDAVVIEIKEKATRKDKPIIEIKEKSIRKDTANIEIEEKSTRKDEGLIHIKEKSTRNDEAIIEIKKSEA